MNTTPTRRTLIRGAAWSAPLIATSSAIPAYAASPTCTTTASFGGDTYFWYGQAYYDSATRTYYSQRTTMSSEFNDARLTFEGLAAGEKINSISFTFLVENMPTNADRRQLPTGMLDGTTASRRVNGTLAAGWAITSISGSSPRSTTINGRTFTNNMWGVTFTNSTGIGLYTDSPDGCRSFTTGNFITSPLKLIYDNVYSLALPPEPEAIPNQVFLATATTSTGKIIELKATLREHTNWFDQEVVVR